jgi:hypothetical protein
MFARDELSIGDLNEFIPISAGEMVQEKHPNCVGENLKTTSAEIRDSGVSSWNRWRSLGELNPCFSLERAAS